MKCSVCGNDKKLSACIGAKCISCWLDAMCCCGCIPRAGNADCERCTLIRKINSITREFDEYMKSLAESIGCDMEVFARPSSHGNDQLRWAVLIQDRLGELGVLHGHPSAEHPPAEYRCGICGGCVRFDGTKPDGACWPHGRKR